MKLKSVMLAMIIVLLSFAPVKAQSLELETGFTALNIKEMRTTIQSFGVSEIDTDIIILHLSYRLDDLVSQKEGGWIFRQLMLSEGGVEFGYRLIKIMETGQKIGAVNELVKTFANQNNRGSKIFLARLFNVPIGVLENLAALSLASRQEK